MRLNRDHGHDLPLSWGTSRFGFLVRGEDRYGVERYGACRTGRLPERGRMDRRSSGERQAITSSRNVLTNCSPPGSSAPPTELRAAPRRR